MKIYILENTNLIDFYMIHDILIHTCDTSNDLPQCNWNSIRQSFGILKPMKTLPTATQQLFEAVQIRGNLAEFETDEGKTNGPVGRRQCLEIDTTSTHFRLHP